MCKLADCWRLGISVRRSSWSVGTRLPHQQSVKSCVISRRSWPMLLWTSSRRWQLLYPHRLLRSRMSCPMARSPPPHSQPCRYHCRPWEILYLVVTSICRRLLASSLASTQCWMLCPVIGKQRSSIAASLSVCFEFARCVCSFKEFVLCTHSILILLVLGDDAGDHNRQ